MKSFFTFLITVGTILLHAQTFEWVNQIGGSMAQISNAVTTDPEGNFYITGSFEGTVDFDPGPATYNLTSTGGSDIFISRMTAAGALLWVRQIGGNSTYTGEGGKDIVVGISGSIYITGVFVGVVDFDPGVMEYYMESEGPYHESCVHWGDVFVLKLSPDGDFTWAKQVGGNGNDEAAAIALGSGEEVYVAGEYVSEGNEPVDIDPGDGTFLLTAISGSAAFLLKLNTDGDFMWAKQWYSSGLFAYGCGLRDALVHPLSLIVDGTGNVYCTGDFGFSVDFDPDQGVYSIGANSNAAFVMKLNSNGGLIWVRALNNSGSHAYGKDVAVGSNGNVYSVGLFDGTIDFDPGAGTKNLKTVGSSGPSGIGPSDAYVWVLNSFGNYVWAGQLGGNTDDAARSVDLDGADNIYVTGTFTGTADFNPGSAKNTLKSAGGTDIFITKLTANGGYAWAVRIGGTSGEYVYALDVDVSGSISTTGVFQGTADFNPSSATSNLTSLGGNDAFVLKLSQGAVLRPDDTEIVSRSTTFDMKLYPNPASERAYFYFTSEGLQPYTLILTDMTGKIVLYQTCVPVKGVNRHEIQLNNLVSGTYTLVWISGDHHESKILIIE